MLYAELCAQTVASYALCKYPARGLVPRMGGRQAARKSLCWEQELDARLKKDTAGVRQEILQLCEGMKHVQLTVHGNDEVEYSLLLFLILLLLPLPPCERAMINQQQICLMI